MLTAADRLSRDIEAVAAGVLEIRPLSTKSPHVFLEDKHALNKRLLAIARDLRGTFAGPAGQFRSGEAVVTRRGREVRVPVEIRRRAA